MTQRAEANIVLTLSCRNAQAIFSVMGTVRRKVLISLVRSVVEGREGKLDSGRRRIIICNKSKRWRTRVVGAWERGSVGALGGGRRPESLTQRRERPIESGNQSRVRQLVG